jgi:hypothetical protein
MLELWGASVFVAYLRVLKGENRKAVLQDLGNKVLPPTRGGKLLSTPEQKAGVKLAYDEMKACIKEIRTHLNIPLKETEGYEWGEDYTNDFKQFFPEVEKIFEKGELKLLCQQPSIRKTASEIIATSSTRRPQRSINMNIARSRRFLITRKNRSTFSWSR